MAVQPISLGPQMQAASIATFQGYEDASETWGKGSVLIEGTATLAQASADPVSGIVGISADRSTGTTNALAAYYPALEGVVFEGNLSTGGANPPTAYALTQGDFLTRYALQIDTSQTDAQGYTITGVWYIDQADTTNVSVTIIGFRDAIGVNDARVYFVINADTTVYAT